jgi:hypothetical protein
MVVLPLYTILYFVLGGVSRHMAAGIAASVKWLKTKVLMVNLML